MKFSSNSLSARRRRSLRLVRGFSMAALLAAVPSITRATTYDYTAGTGNWSTTTNWSPPAPAKGPDGAATSAATTTDTAILDDTTANRIVSYDTGASGFLNTLQINQTDAFTNELQLSRTLNIATATTLGSAGGTAMIDVQNFTLTVPTLTLNTGSLLMIGLTGAANSSTGNVISSCSLSPHVIWAILILSAMPL